MRITAACVREVQDYLEIPIAVENVSIPTITLYDPYDPPKFAGALQVFRKGKQELVPNVDVHELSRAATPPARRVTSAPQLAGFKQSTGMFDAANGTVLERLNNYAAAGMIPTVPP